MTVAYWSLFGAALGGIGLLLLGMGTMTEGLRLAAGSALRSLLSHATRSPLRAIASGTLITGLVQSSSATTVATIGFVNAGLLNLGQAVPVIYGSNVGTTATAWLVALIGFHLNVRLFALPMIGLGMMLRVFGGDRRVGAIGLALVGFGLFFTGIELLRNAFAELGTAMPIAELVRAGPLGIVIALGLGFLLTLLMQSSSAALTIILTLAAGGLVSLPSGAVMVIGANIGTTSTAMIAVIGATANAKRAAAAHLTFNLGTGILALLLLPLLLGLLQLLGESLDRGASAAALLATFHTAFNFLGVLLFLPLTPRLVRFLSRRFRTPEEDLARPHFLDETLKGTPVLALDALFREMDRVTDMSRELVGRSIQEQPHSVGQFSQLAAAIEQLLEVVADYCQGIQRAGTREDSAEALAVLLRALRHLYKTLDAAREARAMATLAVPLPVGRSGDVQAFIADIRAELARDDEGDADALRASYEQAKTSLLRLSDADDVRQVVRYIDCLSALRRAVEDIAATRGLLDKLRSPDREKEGSAVEAAGGP